MSADPEISCPPIRSQLSAHPDLRVSVGIRPPPKAVARPFRLLSAVAHTARDSLRVGPRPKLPTR
jgi:hypothetical protein